MTFVFQNIYSTDVFAFKLKFCFYILMEYTLNESFKRELNTDAICSIRYGAMSLREWADSYLASQEVLFPGEVACVNNLATKLDSRKLGFDPHTNLGLIKFLLDEIERQ